MTKKILSGFFDGGKGTRPSTITLDDDNAVVQELFVAVKDNTANDLCVGYSNGDYGNCYDKTSNTRTTDRIAKLTNATTEAIVTEAYIPANAFASSGEFQIMILSGTVSNKFSYIAICEVA